MKRLVKRAFVRKEMTGKQRWLRCTLQCSLWVGIMAGMTGVNSGATALMNYGKPLPPDMVYAVQPVTLTQSAVYLIVGFVLIGTAALIADSRVYQGEVKNG